LAVFDFRNRSGASEEMSFLDHLEELRWHLIRSVCVLLVAVIVMFFNIRFVTDEIILAPYSSEFPTYKYICQLSPDFCFENNKVNPQGAQHITGGQIIFQATDPSEEFMRAIFIAFIGGLVIAFPYLCWEIWRFVKPGLHPHERKGTRGFVLATSFLFFSGLLFSYYVIAPFTISFLSNFSLSEKIVKIWKIGEVISLVVMLCLAGGVLFEMPVLAYFLAKMGVLGSATLSQFRKHAVIVIFIVSGILTPSADVFSQLGLALPLLLLYEVSIWVVKYVNKQEEKRLENLKSV
jgi:sec-independent protein translocase protein TatC